VTDIFLDGGNAFSTYATPTAPPAVIAADLATASTRTPYLTAVEFTEAGTGVDVSQLVPQGSTNDQSAALLRVIRQASAWADSLTYKVLAATSDTDRYTGPVNAGVMAVPLRYGPVAYVTGIVIAPADCPWQKTALTDLTQAGLVSPTLLRFAPPLRRTGRLYTEITYVNGWTNTTVAGAAAAGDMALTLASTLGVYPGQTLTVDDGATTEQVTVDTGYVVGQGNPVPLAAPIVNAHSVGAAATAMPPDIKRAVISLTACLIKTRGSEAFVMSSMTSPPSKTELSESGGIEDFEIATDLLERYRRVW
jgi:hypothetical protein